MRSPRFLRKHRIKIRNKISEQDGCAQYQTTEINHVFADGTYGMKQAQKGITIDGNLQVVVDMNDLVAFEGAKKREYLYADDFEKLDDTNGFFTVRPDVDLIYYKGHEYTVSSVGTIDREQDQLDFLEIIANE